MKKKLIPVLMGIVLMVFIIVISYKGREEKTFKQDGVTYALSVDGTSANAFPSKGLYKVAAECTNAKGHWLYDEWKLAIEGITGEVSCDISFATITKTYLNSYITSLAGTTQGTGQVVNEKGYRYEGKDPNNYIWFNNELWRIIGVFDSASHGQSGQNLVKIMRANSIGGLAWNKLNTNYWTVSSLKSLLNGAYYNAQNGTGNAYCHGSYSAPANCDYRKKGIQDSYRGMIKNVTWYLGGHSDANATAAAFYGYERGTTVSSGRPTRDTGYIGLMYPSDYGYSVLSSSCARTTNLGSYSSATCGGQSWIYGQGDEWTITPYSSTTNVVFSMFSSGNLSNSNYNYADSGYGSRPVLYLDSSVYMIDGDGSLDTPYVIGL